MPLYKPYKSRWHSFSVVLFTTMLMLRSIVGSGQTQTIIYNTPGTSTFTVPANVTKITVEAWGGGGGSGGIGWNSVTSGNGGNGGNTTIVGMTAGGANGSFGTYQGGVATSGAAGGIASGGDINTNGSQGGTYIITTGGTSTGGSGGSSPNGGASRPGNTANGNNVYTLGIAGNFPGGGAAGGAYSRNQIDNIISIGGGGGGAYSLKTEAVSPTQTITYTVGSGGALGIGGSANGGAGANGQIHITYSTFSLTSTSATSPDCSSLTSSVTISSNATGLPNGNYTVTYTLTGNNAGTYSTNVTVSSNSATFNTVTLTGSTTLTVTNIQNTSYGNNIFANNTASIIVNASVGGLISGGTSPICLNSSTGTMTLTGYTGTINRWERQINSGGWSNMWNAGNTTFSENASWPAGIWEYRVVVQNGSCAETYSSVRTIVVDPLTVGGWMSGPNNPICLGSSTGTITVNGITGSVLRWEKRVNSGAWVSISNTVTTYSETPSSAGIWDYRALLQSGSCLQVYSPNFSITVNPIPSVTFGSNPIICQGNTTALLSYSSTTGTPTSYGIDFDPSANSVGFTDFSGWGFPSSPISIGVPWNAPLAVYNGTLTVGNGSCSGNSYPITVTVSGSVPNIPGAISGSTTVCPGGTNLNYSISPVAGASGYTWTVPAGWTITSGQGTTSIIVTAGSAGQNGDVSVTANSGCGHSAARTLGVTVSSGLPVSVSIAANTGTTICAGTSVTFTATPTNGGTTPAYQWKLNGTNVGSNSPTYTTTTLVNGNVVTCELTSNVSCPTGNPATSNGLTMDVISTPVVNNSPTYNICSGESTSIILTATPPSTFSWTIGTKTGTFENPQPVGGNVSTIDQILLIPNNATTGSVEYIVTPTTTTGSCVGAPFSITVTVEHPAIGSFE